MYKKEAKTTTFNDLWALCNTRLISLLNPYLIHSPSLDLKAAADYTLLAGGKRLRPLLVYATGDIFNAPLDALDIGAAAVELIHTYSLIHDDLPCMDNADLRRGKPSCHISFGEEMAVLVGDAFNTLAFQIITSHPSSIKPGIRLLMAQQLSEASGIFGMVAGQAFDMTLMNDANISEDLLLNVYRLKTGALISCCIELGRLASQDDDEINQAALKEFGECLGLAFQIQDDILDIESTTQTLGKSQGMDVKNKKMTYPKRFGVIKAQDKMTSLYQQALQAINYLGHRAQLLRTLTMQLMERHQ